VKVSQASSVAWRIVSGAQNILLRQTESGLLERFVESQPADFFDMLSVMDDPGVEPLLVIPSRQGFVWLAGMARIAEGEWEGMVSECPRLENIDTTYAIRMDPDEQRKYLEDIFASFSSWLPDGFPLRQISLANSSVLAARVALGERWFLRIPLPVYACSLDYPVRQYRSVEYIVTAKNFAQYLRERQETTAGLRDVPTVLRKATVIINTYAQMKVERAARGTELLLEALSLFRDVSIDGEKLTLRWYLNPTGETISSILEDNSVAYVYADFESGRGKWEIGKGPRRSWDTKNESLEVSEQDEFFEFPGRTYDLSHIKLMRVYHCNAAYRHGDAREDGRNPADERSIIHQLLVAGAGRVEGGLTRESYFDFLRSVIELLLSPQMRFIMKMKCWGEGRDFSELVTRLEEFVPDAS
jgi:hypothetical protein